MDVEIITIGDELLIGQVVDTNSAWMGQELNKVGIEVLRITSVRDRAEEMTNAFTQALQRVDVVLVTGGLGPTKDDVTKQVLCDFFGGTLVHNEEVHTHLLALLERRGLTINPSTLTQCMVPTSCRPLQNSAGTAPIMWFEKEGKTLISMPGVPIEMKVAMTQQVIPQLIASQPIQTAIQHHTLLVGGYTESLLSQHLTAYEDQLDSRLKLAYLPAPGLIRLRLTARCHTPQEAESLLEDAVERLRLELTDHIICEGDLTLAAAVGSLLQQQNSTIATAESCTGGTIAQQLAATSGASAWFNGSVVAYANSAKEQLLHIPTHLLETEGAVSIPVVEGMARSAQQLFGTTCAIATSGIAGPTGGTAEKPVGTVCIAIAKGVETFSHCYHFVGDRDRIVQRSAHTALLLLAQWLSTGKYPKAL